MSSSPRRSYFGLQAGRGLAAVMVVIFHSAQLVGGSRFWSYAHIAQIFHGGALGVEYFFALSGAVIFLAHHKHIGNAARFRPFLWKRFRRIYPIYWIALLGTLALYWSGRAPSLSGPIAPWRLLSNSTLIYLPHTEPILAVSWTLFHEIFFYAAFATLLLSKRVGTGVLTLWFLCSCVIRFVPASAFFRQYFFSPLHLIFGLGMLAAWLLLKRNVPFAGSVMVAGMAIFAATVIQSAFHPVFASITYLFAGLGAALVILGGSQLEDRGRLRVPGVLRFLGDASYSVYLFHLLALAAIAPLLHHLAPAASPAWLMLFLVAGGTAAGCLVHVAIERPLLARLSGLEIFREPSAERAFERQQASVSE